MSAYGTAVSFMCLSSVGLLIIVAGAIVSLIHPMPIPSLGFLLLVMGGVCLIFVFLIWQVIDRAMLDEVSLNGWLPKTLGKGGPTTRNG